MNCVTYRKLNMLAFMVMIGLYFPQTGYGAANTADVEGRDVIGRWIRDDNHNKYGKKMELHETAQLDVLLGRLEPAARTFQQHLSTGLSNNKEFKDSAYLFRRPPPTRKELGLETLSAVAGGLSIYFASISPISDAAKYGGYAAGGAALVKSFVILAEPLWHACLDKCGKHFPMAGDIKIEAEKISLLLTFRYYSRIRGRFDELDRVVGEYIDRVLGVLAGHYPKGSKESPAITILRCMT